MTRQSKHRQKRRELGLCCREGCKIQSGRDFYCEDHAAQHAAYQKALRARRKAPEAGAKL